MEEIRLDEKDVMLCNGDGIIFFKVERALEGVITGRVE